MQRMAWTDERLGERFDGIDRRFDKVDRRFDKVEQQLGEFRQDIIALHMTLHRGSIGVSLALIGVIAAILAS